MCPEDCLPYCFPQGLETLGFDWRHCGPITERAARRGAETPQPGTLGLGCARGSPILSLSHVRSHTGSAVDLRFPLSTAAPGLRRRFSLREESAKVRVEGEGASPGRWGHFAACLAPVSQLAGVWYKSSPAPHPVPVTAAALDGASAAATAALPHLPVPGAHRGVCTCAWVCRRVFGWGWGRMELAYFWNNAVVCGETAGWQGS